MSNQPRMGKLCCETLREEWHTTTKWKTMYSGVPQWQNAKLFRYCAAEQSSEIGSRHVLGTYTEGVISLLGGREQTTMIRRRLGRWAEDDPQKWHWVTARSMCEWAWQGEADSRTEYWSQIDFAPGKLADITCDLQLALSSQTSCSRNRDIVILRHIEPSSAWPGSHTAQYVSSDWDSLEVIMMDIDRTSKELYAIW